MASVTRGSIGMVASISRYTERVEVTMCVDRTQFTKVSQLNSSRVTVSDCYSVRNKIPCASPKTSSKTRIIPPE